MYPALCGRAVSELPHAEQPGSLRDACGCNSTSCENIPRTSPPRWLRARIFPARVRPVGRGPEYSPHESAPLAEGQNILVLLRVLLCR
eukprot:1181645-Prorocentrum_minimum.AAC.2